MAKKSKAEAPTPVHIAEETVPAKLNKSEEIRKEAERIKELTGEKPRPKDIVATLKARGIEVSAPAVSQALKTGKSTTSRKTKPTAAAPQPERKKPTKTTSSSFTVEELKAANKFVKTIGDSARAVELMDAMFGG
jgi:arginine repressor